VSRRYKAADVKFYIDADILGLAKAIADLREDVTYPGDPGAVVRKRQRPPCPIESPSVNDDEWIPEVTSRGWLIITRDRRIRTQPREIKAVLDHGARMVRLVGSDSVGTFSQLELLMCRWRDVLKCLEEPGPFIYAASRTSFRSVSLDDPPPGRT
jgi:hypothetical protein